MLCFSEYPGLTERTSFAILQQWRSPEEYKDEPLSDKIDVYSVGNNMYRYDLISSS